MVEFIEIFERAQIQRNRKRSSDNFDNYNFLFKWGERQLLDRLSFITKKFSKILIIGARQSDAFLNDLSEQLNPEFVIQTDINDCFFSTATKNKVICEYDILPFAPNSFDLIISNLNFHTINDLPGALIQMRQILKPDGLLLSSMAGGETLKELRQSLNETEMKLKDGISPRVHPFADKQDMGALLQRADYALPVVDSDTITVTYETMFKLLQDLRGMGENNSIAARNKTYTGRNFFFKAAQHYHDNFAENDGRIPATFEIIFISGWAPHESQQQPLKPGSAEHRLSDVLKTNEIQIKE